MLGWLVPAALACGGLFCDSGPPTDPQALRVDQTAERILFSVDPVAQTTEVQVQISFEGAADQFAWIVPVPAIPDLSTANQDVIDLIAAATAPTFHLNFSTEGDCRQRRSRCCDDKDASAEDADDVDVDTDSAEGDITIAGQLKVRPYETVTLQATSAQVLLDWLQAAGFALPDDLDPKLAPYVAGGSWFVALKLAKDADAGDLVPLGMTYAGVEPTVPLQLTAVAAQPDLRLEVYMIGGARAVPGAQVI